MDKGTLTGIFMNITSVVGIVLLNKQITNADGFGFSVFLSSLHFITTALATRLFLKLNMFTYKECPFFNVLVVASVNLGSVAFMNLSLMWNSVGFYQLSKLACVPVVLLGQVTIYDQMQSRKVLGTLVPLLIGVAIATVTDVQVNFLGTAYACCAVFFTACAHLFTSKFSKSLEADAMQLLYHTSPVVAAGMILLIPIFESPAEIAAFEWTSGTLSRVLITCLLSVAVNVSNYMVLGKTSALTYQVLGHFKTMCILGIGITLFNNEISLVNLGGIGLAMVGIIMYTEVKRRESEEKYENQRRK